MANLKTLKNRIKSVKSTQKITKAMKMVAASRLKKAKNLVESSRSYAYKLAQLTSDLASNIAVRGTLNQEFPLLTGKGNNNIHLLVVISSDRGLCGGLNTATVKFVKQTVTQLLNQGREVKIFCLGKKAYEPLKNVLAKNIIGNQFGLFRSIVNFNDACQISEKIIELFNNNQFDICNVIYSKFKSAISQEQVMQQIIPAPINYHTQKQLGESPIEYQPNQEEILSQLLPKNIAVQFYIQLLENVASEQGARMSAMESASNNASKMIKNLSLIYNRTRQANITKELIDIISGANTV